jgi:hypothetical protein
MEVKVVSLKNEVERLSEQIAESVNQSGGTSPKVDAEWRAAQERLADATSAYAAVQGEARQAADAVDGAMTGQVEGESADNGLSTIMDPILFDMLRSMPNQPEPHASETEEAPTDNADLWYWPGEWRIRLSFGDAYGRLARAGRKQREEEMAYYLSQQLGSRVQVLVKDPYVFLYPGEHDEDVATRALVNEVLAEPYVRASVVLHYRNPRDRRWFFLTSESAEVEDVQKMQEDAEERHKLEIEADSARSKYSGLATWQVRVLFRSHHDTAEFARTLRADGYLPVRYWKYLIIGARHEDHARAIAEALEGQVPPGTRFIVERPFLI